MGNFLSLSLFAITMLSGCAVDLWQRRISCRPCEKSGLLTIAAGEARISSNFCHLSSTLALELA